jgi:polar amino acid transport system permease protein
MATYLDYLGYLAVGIKSTALVGLISLAAGLCLSFTVGLVRFARIPILSQIAFVYVEIFRGTSLLIQLFWIYFSLPMFGITMSPFLAGCLGLALNNGAYGSEIVRGALASVSKEQFEAATALNFSAFHTLRKIIIPQALPEMVPPFGNLSILLLKDTALISMINIMDITFRAQQLRTHTHDSVGVYSVTLIVYFALALVVVFATRLVEMYMRPSSRGSGLLVALFGSARP